MSSHNIPFSIKRKKKRPKLSKNLQLCFFRGPQERIRNSQGKRVIGVRATEDLLYLKGSSILS